MLKNPASSVLASFRSSTYPRGYASGLHSLRPCWTAFLSILLTLGAMTLCIVTAAYCAEKPIFRSLLEKRRPKWQSKSTDVTTLSLR
jgi:hypothetical protein